MGSKSAKAVGPYRTETPMHPKTCSTLRCAFGHVTSGLHLSSKRISPPRMWDPNGFTSLLIATRPAVGLYAFIESCKQCHPDRDPIQLAKIELTSIIAKSTVKSKLKNAERLLTELLKLQAPNKSDTSNQETSARIDQINNNCQLVFGGNIGCLHFEQHHAEEGSGIQGWGRNDTTVVEKSKASAETTRVPEEYSDVEDEGGLDEGHDDSCQYQHQKARYRPPPQTSLVVIYLANLERASLKYGHGNVVDEKGGPEPTEYIVDQDEFVVETLATHSECLGNATSSESSPAYSMLMEKRKDEDIPMKEANIKPDYVRSTIQDKVRFFDLKIEKCMSASAAAKQLGIHIRTAQKRAKKYNMCPDSIFETCKQVGRKCILSEEHKTAVINFIDANCSAAVVEVIEHLLNRFNDLRVSQTV
ncbi:hypothetical protein VTP01DRAFT_3523 [Rhizomucor pusillus]|uniref:uncharacterized protein n=1 Tax=Rhizomucor pusillus TaxID=4840 RepID=UPI003742BF3A